MISYTRSYIVWRFAWSSVLTASVISWSTSALQYFELVPLHVMWATRRLASNHSFEFHAYFRSYAPGLSPATRPSVWNLVNSTRFTVAVMFTALSIDATAADVSSPL